MSGRHGPGGGGGGGYDGRNHGGGRGGRRGHYHEQRSMEPPSFSPPGCALSWCATAGIMEYLDSEYLFISFAVPSDHFDLMRI